MSDVTGILPAAGTAATLGAALLGPAIATYTAALICDTAVPSWHEGYREMPYLYPALSGAAGGLGLLAVRPADAGPARRLAVAGASVELVAKQLMMRRLAAAPGLESSRGLAEPYEKGRAGDRAAAPPRS